MMTDTHTHTHTHAYPWSYVCTKTLTHTQDASFISLPGALHDTHTSSYELEICLMMTRHAHTHTHIHAHRDGLHKCIFLFHIYRSVSFARIRRYTQLAYLFHQCATSLLGRDSRIADCTVKHPSVEHPFSNLVNSSVLVRCGKPHAVKHSAVWRRS